MGPGRTRSSVVLDLTIGEGDETDWIYRRDPSVRLPWDTAVLSGGSGIPYLAPEIQLLFKSSSDREKDATDAEVVIPRLGPERLRWLQRQLPGSHPWQHLISLNAPRP